MKFLFDLIILCFLESFLKSLRAYSLTMTIPTLTPPTDNLYKFLAITGLVFTIFCVVYPTSFLTPSNSTIALLNTDLRKLEADYEYLQQNITRQALNAQTTVDDITSQPQTQQQLLEIEHTIIQLDELLKQEVRQIKHLETIRKILYYLSLLGGIITGSGFSLWYSKVQKYQDKLLEIDVASKLKLQNLDANSTKSENELPQSDLKVSGTLNPSQATSPIHKG